MSIKRAFEKFNVSVKSPQHKMREAKGVVNEMTVEVELYFYDDTKTWQLSVDIWNFTGRGPLHRGDIVYPKTQSEAEDRFNRLVTEYNLRERKPKLESRNEEA